MTLLKQFNDYFAVYCQSFFLHDMTYQDVYEWLREDACTKCLNNRSFSNFYGEIPSPSKPDKAAHLNYLQPTSNESSFAH
jgi:hypothetical protein